MSCKCSPVDASGTLTVDIQLNIHHFSSVHAEKQDVLVIYGVHSGVYVELVAKTLGRGEKPHATGRTGISAKIWAHVNSNR